MNPGPIWPCLALFTPTVEAGNGATLASLGTPFTRTHWASMRPRWPSLASSGVARSGETFNSVAFGCISLLSCRLRGAGVSPSSSPSPLTGDLCVAAPDGRSSSHPPARYACGGHPHAPGSGASPLCTPPFERLREAPLCVMQRSPQGRRDLTVCAGGTLTLTLSQRARGSEHLGVKFQFVAHLAPFGLVYS